MFRHMLLRSAGIGIAMTLWILGSLCALAENADPTVLSVDTEIAVEWGGSEESIAYGHFIVSRQYSETISDFTCALYDLNCDGTDELLLHSSDDVYFVYGFDGNQVISLGACCNFNRYGTYYSRAFNALVIIASGGADWITYEYYRIDSQMELIMTIEHNFFEPGGTVTEDNPYGYQLFRFFRIDQTGTESEMTAAEWDQCVNELEEITLAEFDYDTWYAMDSDSVYNNAEPVTQVAFEREYVNEGMQTLERALITGLTDAGDIVWSVVTDGYPAAELPSCNEFGIYQDAYYYMEGENLTKRRLSDGGVVWSCQCGGSPAPEAILYGYDGTIYYSGYYGPVFVAVDCDGNLIKMLDMPDIPYYWPYKLKFTADGEISVFFEGSDSGSGVVVDINTETWEYYVPQPGISLEKPSPALEILLRNIPETNADEGIPKAFCQIDMDGDGTKEVIVRTYTPEATEGGRYIYNVYYYDEVMKQYAEAVDGEFYSYANEDFVRFDESNRNLVINWTYADEVNFVIYAYAGGKLYLFRETQKELSHLPMLQFQDIDLAVAEDESP